MGVDRGRPRNKAGWCCFVRFTHGANLNHQFEDPVSQKTYPSPAYEDHQRCNPLIRGSRLNPRKYTAAGNLPATADNSSDPAFDLVAVRLPRDAGVAKANVKRLRRSDKFARSVTLLGHKTKGVIP
jgi:hypothetical protein